MVKSRVIKNAVDQLQQLLREQELIKIGKLSTYTNRFIVWKVKDSQGKCWVVKFQRVIDPFTTHLFRKEVFAYRRLKKGQLGRFISGEFKEAFTKEPPMWSIVAFVEGKLVGDTIRDMGFPARVLTPQFREEIIKLIIGLEQQKLVGDFNRFLEEVSPFPEDVRDGNWLVNQLQEQTMILDQLGQRPQGVLDWLRQGISKVRAAILAHTDLTSQNLILTETKKLVAVDWENVSLALPGYDAALVWLQAWRSPHWQSRFLSALVNRVPDENLFARCFHASVVVKVTEILAFLKKHHGEESTFKKVWSHHQRVLNRAMQFAILDRG